MRAGIHYLATVFILSIYGGRVCPYIETLAVWDWLLQLSCFFRCSLCPEDMAFKDHCSKGERQETVIAAFQAGVILIYPYGNPDSFL